MVGDKIGIGSNYKWPIFEIKGISPSGKIAVLIGKSYFVYESKNPKVRRRKLISLIYFDLPPISYGDFSKIKPLLRSRKQSISTINLAGRL